MTFTYDLASLDGTIVDISKIRLEIGDTISGDGVLPDRSNLSDEEISVISTREGGGMRAVAAVCELLSRHWARVANITVGPRKEELGKVSEQWLKIADDIREDFGFTSGRASTSALTRVDGYSDDILSDEV
jgi:hypothetical protein